MYSLGLLCLYSDIFVNYSQSVSSHFLVIIPQLILSIVWHWGNFWFWLLILLILFVMSVGGYLSAFLISSVAQSCLTLCDLMDCSMPGFPVLHHLPALAQTHVHRIGDAIQPSHPPLSPSPLAFNLSQHQSVFSESALLIRWPKYWSFQLQHQSFQ